MNLVKKSLTAGSPSPSSDAVFPPPDLGCGIQDLGFAVWGLGFGV